MESGRVCECRQARLTRHTWSTLVGRPESIDEGDAGPNLLAEGKCLA